MGTCDRARAIRNWSARRRIAMVVVGLFGAAWLVSFAIVVPDGPGLHRGSCPWAAIRLSSSTPRVASTGACSCWPASRSTTVRGLSARVGSRHRRKAFRDHRRRARSHLRQRGPGATIHGFECDETYLGRWTAAALSKVKLRPNQRAARVRATTSVPGRCFVLQSSSRLPAALKWRSCDPALCCVSLECPSGLLIVAVAVGAGIY